MTAPHKQKHKLEQHPFVLCLVTAKMINVQVPVADYSILFIAVSPLLQ